MTQEWGWAIGQAIIDLEAAHQQESFTVSGPRGVSSPRGGCATCSPRESGWPCMARMVAYNLQAALYKEDDDE